MLRGRFSNSQFRGSGAGDTSVSPSVISATAYFYVVDVDSFTRPYAIQTVSLVFN